MKQVYTRPFSTVLSLAIFGMVAPSAKAATLMTMTFDNGNADIVETTGWNGTTAPGGGLATGLTISSGMQIYGNFTAHNRNNAFVAHNWNTTNSADTRVGTTIGTTSGFAFNLGDGTGAFSTLVHHMPESQIDVFTSVELIINGISIGPRAYTPVAGASGFQTLTWSIPNNTSLNNLTSAIIDMKFSSLTSAGGPNHGPQWELADGAFVSLAGTVIPEPSQAVLACLGLGLALVRRKR